MRQLRSGLVAAALAVVMVACSSGEAKQVTLDGSPRFPDAEGVALEANRDRIVLDGNREYKVSASLRSFSTYNLETIPLIRRKGQYVQVGLDGKTVIWIAGIADVVRTTPPRVYYVGQLKKLEGRNGVFADGTVLTFSKAVAAKAKPGSYTALIDPDKHEVVELRAS